MGLFSKKESPVWAGTGKKAKTEGVAYVQACTDLEELKQIAAKADLSVIQDAAMTKIEAVDKNILKEMYQYQYHAERGQTSPFLLNKAIIERFTDDEEFLESVLFSGKASEAEVAAKYITSHEAMVKFVMAIDSPTSFDFLAVNQFVEKLEDRAALEKLVELYKNYNPSTGEYAPFVNDKRRIGKIAARKLS